MGTVEPRFNETLYNEVVGPSNSKIYEKKKPRNNETSFSELICVPVPCPLVISSFHRMCRWPLRTPTPLKSSSVAKYRPGRYSLYKLYRYGYVPPQRVGFLNRFDLKTGIDFAKALGTRL